MNCSDFMSVYIKTKISGNFLDSTTEPIDAFKIAENNDDIRIWDDKIHFCCFKTTFEEKESIIIYFSMELMGPVGGSSSCSEKVMSLVDHISKQLQIIDSLKYYKYPIKEEKRKNIIFLKVIKVIRDEDIL